jgi:hypothetical protein
MPLFEETDHGHDAVTDVPLARSRFIAAIIGPVLAALGVSMLVNGGLVAEMAREMVHGEAIILISGVLLLVAGLGIVLNHSTWHRWPAVITLLGWAAILGGLIRILMPFRLAAIAATVGDSTLLPLLSGGAMLVLGAFLCLKAFNR